MISRPLRLSVVAGVVVAMALAGCDKPVRSGRSSTLTFAAGRSTPVADPQYPAYGNAALDVLHYGLEFGWSPGSKVLTATATITLRAAAAVPTISLDLAGTFTVDGTTVDGRPAAGAVSGNKLTVSTSLSKDRTVTLVVRYHGRPAPIPGPTHRPDTKTVGMTVTDDGSLWTFQEPYGAFTWFPVNDLVSDKALYDVSVTVPAGWSAVASGTPQPRAGGTFRYTSVDPMASYLVVLAVSDYRRETDTGPHGLPITYWVRPYTTGTELTALRRAPDQLTWLEKLFGPYPFPSAGLVLVPFPSAEETQQMVTMGEPLLAAGGNGEDDTQLHELAHQWFGDTVTPKTWTDLWLNEGFAQYAEIRYAVEHGYTTMAVALRQGAKDDATLRTEYGPPGHPTADDFAEPNVYVCGALMLIELQKKLGDTAFLALLRDWVQQHRGTNQDRASFITFVNAHSGQDLTAWLTSWLDSATTPPLV